MKKKINEWTGTLVTPAHYLCTGVSRDPPKSAYYAVDSICRNHEKLQHSRNGYREFNNTLMLVTQHTPSKGNGQDRSCRLITILLEEQDQNYVKTLSPTKGTSCQLIMIFKH